MVEGNSDNRYHLERLCLHFYFNYSILKVGIGCFVYIVLKILFNSDPEEGMRISKWLKTKKWLRMKKQFGPGREEEPGKFNYKKQNAGDAEEVKFAVFCSEF